ncbi:MAG: (Fe-S)-binding protein [Alphaproteobacteria bacterium]
MSSPRIRVGLFVTCLVDLVRPQVGFAALRLLEEAGCDVVVPRGQTCCGQPAYNAGDRKNAAALVRQTITAFEDVDYVVVPSGSCAAILRLHGPELLAGDPDLAERARTFGEKVHELTAFLKDVLGVAEPPAASGAGGLRDVVYHDSCAGLRELGIREAPRALLREVKGLTLRELGERDVCCGFGGTFCVKFPEISERLATDKSVAAEEAGAKELVGGDLGCLLHLAGNLRARGSRLRVRHVAEVLAGLDDKPAIGEPVED